jgi:hypothetical protein
MGEKLFSKTVDMAVWERQERVALLEAKDTLLKQVRDDIDLPSYFEVVSERVGAEVP